MGKAPAFQFYVKDWLVDTELQLTPTSTRGIWMNLLCHMWNAQDRGILIVSKQEIMTLTGATDAECTEFISQAMERKFCDLDGTDNGRLIIKNRRMYREAKKSRQNRDRQQRFRDKGGGDPAKWNSIRIQILERDNFICAYCGKAAKTVDHITPKSKGGTEIYSNLVACCKSCNQIKNNRSLKDAKFTFHKGFDESILKNNTFITPPSPSPTPTALHIYDRKFEKFWKIYPNKIGKKYAYKCWNNTNDKPGINEIIKAVKRQCKWPRWKKNNGEFIPNPAKWIREGRWDDCGVTVKNINRKPKNELPEWMIDEGLT